eukprot:TRINITY_DN80385_c0_g1_i1.p1 TRINITY_DN80385_c0_g1~~TRINITY_DN80385_c0_g1_i1.p1  ORF type:complete len:343 (+),score=131.24 TRINITY_DN80385_c0_g1_i1:101-1129(+)
MSLVKKAEERAKLDKLTIKELRRQAALSNVPLTHISAAVEKNDLIAMILKAGPALDHYDANTQTKVWSAESIARAANMPKPKKEKKKKKKEKKKKSSSSSSSSESDKKRKKRSRSEPKMITMQKKKARSRSSSLELVSAPLAIANQPAAKRKQRPVEKAKPQVVSIDKTLDDMMVTDLTDDVLALPAEATLHVQDEEAPPDLLQVGKAAAAALGFDVNPKAPAPERQAPKPGLRPSINHLSSTTPFGSAIGPGARPCVAYLTNAKCDLGDKCPDAHIIDPEEEMRVRAKFKEMECHHGSSCSRPGCLYRHPGERVDNTVVSVAEGKQVTMTPTAQGMQLNYH